MAPAFECLPHPLRVKIRAACTCALLSWLVAPACARRSGSEGIPSQGNAPTAAPAIAASSAVTAHDEGPALYARYCALCHAADGSGYAADNAPSLVSKSFLESASDAFIASAISNGRSNTAMAAYGVARGGALDEAKITSIVRFLRSKGPPAAPLPERPVSGDAAQGALLFGQHCLSCHAIGGQRGTAPQLQNPEFLATATPAFLRHAILNGRPPTPMPAFAERLKPQEVEDLLAWIVDQSRSAQPTPLPTTPLVPDDLPLVINPRGKAPDFTLRDDRYVSAEQVKRALEAKRRIVIVDARSPADWIQFRIPGSVPIPYYDAEKLARIPNDGTWVVAYCACPHHASGEVVNALRAKNYRATAVLDEGILFWRDRGYPLEGEAVSKAAPAASGASAKPAKQKRAPAAEAATARAGGPAKP
jgi:mono/diheme cytochrome c family protein/rhodanese-related sulfurtransferase